MFVVHASKSGRETCPGLGSSGGRVMEVDTVLLFDFRPDNNYVRIVLLLWKITLTPLKKHSLLLKRPPFGLDRYISKL